MQHLVDELRERLVNAERAAERAIALLAEERVAHAATWAKLVELAPRVRHEMRNKLIEDLK